LLFVVLGSPRTPEGAGEAIGRGLTHTGIAALVVWLFARGSDWSWLKFVSLYFVAFVGAAIVSTSGHFQDATGSEQHWPFEAAFPDGWTVERLKGASSSPQDQSLGVREIARFGTGTGAPVIQLSCVENSKSEAIDLDQMLERMASGLETQYASPRSNTKSVKSKAMNIHGHPARSIITTVSLDGNRVLQQESLVSQTDECLFAAQVAALPSEFERASAVFRSVVGTIRIR
jgi:hypothetical protein